MGIFDPDDVITEYPIREAVEMGALVEVFKDQWGALSGGKPIVASANVCLMSLREKTGLRRSGTGLCSGRSMYFETGKSNLLLNEYTVADGLGF